MCCSETHNSSAVASIATFFGSEIEEKQSICCLKSKSLNFILLFIEILLYKISAFKIIDYYNIYIYIYIYMYIYIYRNGFDLVFY